MAEVQNQKRQREDDPSKDNPPAKRRKSASQSHRASNFPPKFWDNLSKVHLTRRALRELDRRNRIQLPPKHTRPVGEYSRSLARFSRRGGPDLSCLRGCPEPKEVAHTMASSQSGSSSRQTKSTKATTVTSKARRSSAYDADFEQHLNDNYIYLPFHDYPDDRSTPEPGNLDDIRRELAVTRASLSPSRFTKADFREFSQKNETRSEGSVMRNVIPVIVGGANIPNEGHLPFTNLESMTNDATVNAVPDFFDGAPQAHIDKEVKKALGTKIIPTKHAKDPAVPNFFLEAKAPKGGADVARRQACYDGALGARAMHNLQNYGTDEPVYDGNAYTISSTYHAGTSTLQLYAHHPTAPTTPDGGPEYHMTQLDGWQMTGKPATCIEGLTAFRNARVLVKRHRDSFIASANAKARQPAETPSGGDDLTGTTEVQQDQVSSGDEFVDCEDTPTSHDIGGLPPPPGGVEIDEDGTSHDNDRSTLPPYVYEEVDQQDDSQLAASLGLEDHLTSITASFTSSFTTGGTRTKRSAAPRTPSPPSRKKRTSAKNRGKSRKPDSTTQASTSTAPSPAVNYWTWSAKRENWYHLNEDGSREWYDGEE